MPWQFQSALTLNANQNIFQEHSMLHLLKEPAKQMNDHSGHIFSFGLSSIQSFKNHTSKLPASLKCCKVSLLYSYLHCYNLLFRVTFLFIKYFTSFSQILFLIRQTILYNNHPTNFPGWKLKSRSSILLRYPDAPSIIY